MDRQILVFEYLGCCPYSLKRLRKSTKTLMIIDKSLEFQTGYLLNASQD
jgi:hypothetical protein